MNNKLKTLLLNIEAALKNIFRRKNVLFFIANENMLQYTQFPARLLMKDKRIRVWFCFYKPERFLPGTMKDILMQWRVKQIPYNLARYLAWDLVCFPDHGPFVRPVCKKLFLCHGIHGGVRKAGDDYVFGGPCRDDDGNPKYDIILTASPLAIKAACKNYPDLEGRIKNSGDKFYELMKKDPYGRNKFLSGFGLNPKLKTIMILSTWDNISLIQNEGETLLKELVALSSKQNIIVSIHQNNAVDEYSPLKNWHKVLSEVKLKNYFFLKYREEPFSFFPYVDALITDLTSAGYPYLKIGGPILLYEKRGVLFDPDVTGRFKTGHLWSLQNQPGFM